METSKTLSIQSSLKFGWEQLQDNLKFVYVGFLILFLTSLVFNSLGDIGGILGMLATLYLGFGMLKGLIQIANGKKPELGLLKETQLEEFIYYVVIVILKTIAVVFGMVLFVVPGIYLALRFSLVEYLYVDKKLSISDTFGQSGVNTKGKKLKLLAYFVAVILINIVGAIPFGLGLLITVPVSAVATTHFYKSMIEHKA
jgi:uncharacterized membrane protein